MHIFSLIGNLLVFILHVTNAESFPAPLSKKEEAEIIEKYTVYSKETACAMADVCRKTYNADIGIGVTGSLENVDPENEKASVPGSVWFAFSFKDKIYDYYFEFEPQSTRFECKMVVAKEIANELFKVI